MIYGLEPDIKSLILAAIQNYI